MKQTKPKTSINVNEIKIYVELKNRNQMLAKVSLQYRDMEIHGFRIGYSKFQNRNKNNLWVQVPAYQTGGRYNEVFFLNNIKSWKKLERKIICEYEKILEKHLNKDDS